MGLTRLKCTCWQPRVLYGGAVEESVCCLLEFWQNAMPCDSFEAFPSLLAVS